MVFFQNNPINLDPAYKINLGLWNCLVRVKPVLTLKVPLTTAADDIHKYFFLVFSEKTKSAGQRIHMKNQALFS